MGWLIVVKPRAVIEAGRKVNMSDLKKDFFVMFQKHADPWWNLVFCFALPAFVCVYGWGESLWNGQRIAFELEGWLDWCTRRVFVSKTHRGGEEF